MSAKRFILINPADPALSFTADALNQSLVEEIMSRRLTVIDTERDGGSIFAFVGDGWRWTLLPDKSRRENWEDAETFCARDKDVCRSHELLAGQAL